MGSWGIKRGLEGKEIMARFYDFGCAPDAVAEGFDPHGRVGILTPAEASEKYHDADVALVKGCSVEGNVAPGSSEYFVMPKAA